MQEFKAGCGACAVANALHALGLHEFQEVLHAVTLSSYEGVDTGTLLPGLAKLGYEARPVSWGSGRAALLGLRGLLAAGLPVILAVDQWDHWVAAVGQLGKRVLLADGADAELVLSYDGRGLTRRWERRRKPFRGPPFFGVALARSAV